MSDTNMKRVNWLPAPAAFNLSMACQAVNGAFDGFGCYLVGSATQRRDYRDVDVRYIMGDEEYEKLFPGAVDRPDLHPLWALMCTGISLWLSTQSGQPLGIFRHPTPRDYAADTVLDP